MYWQAQRSAVALAAVFLTVLTAAPGGAAMVTGPFFPCQQSAHTVGTDGSDFFVSDGTEYPVPAELSPTSGFSFAMMPGRYLRAVASDPGLSCVDGTRIWLYEVPSVSGQPLVPVRTGMCLPNGWAGQCAYSAQAFVSPQRLVGFPQQRHPTSLQQRITWVDLVTGSSSDSVLTHQIDSGSIKVAQSGNAALVQHDVLAGAGMSDWSVIDLCPASLGSVLTTFQNLGSGATASIVQTSPGVFVARVEHPSLPGGQQDVSLPNCLATPPPPSGYARLEMQLAGDGDGLVEGQGILRCDTSGNPNRCAVDYPIGHSVFLAALPRNGATFDGWAGDCSGAGNTSILMDQDKTCTAVFDADFADLGVSVSSAPPAVAGAAFSWTAQLSNAGPDSGSATLTATLPPEVTFDSAASSPACSPSGQTITCPAGTLGAGSAASFDVVGAVAGDARGSATLTFGVSGTVLDLNPSNDQQTVQTPLDALVDAGLVARTAGPNVEAGGLALWQLEVTNAGPSTEPQAEVLDILPTGVHPLGAPMATQVSCPLPALEAGASALLTLATRVDGTVVPGTTLLNSAEVSTLETDTDPANDQTSSQAGVVAALPAPAPGTLERLAFTGDQPPGAAQPFSGLDAPAVDGDWVAFAADYPFAGGGVFLDAGAGPLPVLDQGRVPGGGGEVRSAETPSLDAGRLGAVARLDGSESRYYVTDDCGPQGFAGLSPGIEGGTLRGGSVVSMGSYAGGIRVVHQAGGATTILASLYDAMPGSTETFGWFSSRPAWDGQTAAFWGTASGAVAWEGIYAWDAAGGLRVLADRATTIPGRSDTFARFSELLDIDGGLVAFVGIDPQGRGGLYTADATTGALAVVADFATPAVGPGGTAVSLSSFLGSFPSIVGSEVAFVAAEQGGTNRAIYLRDATGVRALQAAGVVVSGNFFLGSISLGPQGFDGQRVAFQSRGFQLPFQPPFTLGEAVFVLQVR
ncbi:MAG: DUF11 domain-containing protein [Holophagales bacterium]|nr:DUF11 domain-containing protein [Holophagales bacterium]